MKSKLLLITQFYPYLIALSLIRLVESGPTSRNTIIN
jgi:hypothetical protein